MLDPALWRRFDEIVKFPSPSVTEIEQLISIKLRNFPSLDLDTKAAARRLKGMSHADVERICIDAVKTCIIEDKDRLNGTLFESAVSQQRERLLICNDAFKKDGKQV
jgi:SpoVK/Ycf46/Vps4 family AAA+-type ATPase